MDSPKVLVLDLTRTDMKASSHKIFDYCEQDDRVLFSIDGLRTTSVILIKKIILCFKQVIRKILLRMVELVVNYRVLELLKQFLTELPSFSLSFEFYLDVRTFSIWPTELWKLLSEKGNPISFCLRTDNSTQEKLYAVKMIANNIEISKGLKEVYFQVNSEYILSIQLQTVYVKNGRYWRFFQDHRVSYMFSEWRLKDICCLSRVSLTERLERIPYKFVGNSMEISLLLNLNFTFSIEVYSFDEKTENFLLPLLFKNPKRIWKILLSSSRNGFLVPVTFFFFASYLRAMYSKRNLGQLPFPYHNLKPQYLKLAKYLATLDSMRLHLII